MSSIPATSIASQPPVAPVQPVAPRQPDPAVAQRIAKGAELTATAVAAQSAKEAGKGLVIDIQT